MNDEMQKFLSLSEWEWTRRLTHAELCRLWSRLHRERGLEEANRMWELAGRDLV